MQKAYDWNVWVLQHVKNFPKEYKFSLGQTITESSLRLLMSLVDATYRRRNEQEIEAAVREVNRLRYLTRLSKDLRILPRNSQEFAAKALDEIGRMAGGWLKSARRRTGDGASGQPVE